MGGRRPRPRTVIVDRSRTALDNGGVLLGDKVTVEIALEAVKQKEAAAA